MWLIHILAIIFCLPALLVTIPLHILIATTKAQQKPQEGIPRQHIAQLATYERNKAGHLVRK